MPDAPTNTGVSPVTIRWYTFTFLQGFAWATIAGFCLPTGLRFENARMGFTLATEGSRGFRDTCTPPPSWLVFRALPGTHFGHFGLWGCPHAPGFTRACAGGPVSQGRVGGGGGRYGHASNVLTRPDEFAPPWLERGLPGGAKGAPRPCRRQVPAIPYLTVRSQLTAAGVDNGGRLVSHGVQCGPCTER